MAENILLDGSITGAALSREFDLEITDKNNASIVVVNPTGDIALELKAGGNWVQIDIIGVDPQSLGIYTSGKFRVVSAGLGATEVVSLHR